MTRANASIGSSRSARRVVPAWLAWPSIVEPPPAVRPDRRRDGDRPVEVDQTAALFDVQFDEGGDPAQRCGVTSDVVRVAARAPDRFGHRDAVLVGQCAGAVGVEGAGDQPRAAAGNAEAGTFLVAEVDDPDRTGGPEPLVPQGIHGQQRRHHTERPVERAAVGHRVQVRAADDTGRLVRVTPPGPLVPGRVLDEVEPARGALVGEPVAQRAVLVRPGESPVSTGGRPTDRRELRPQTVEGHQPSFIGTRTPRSAATSSARE